jgi:adenosylhomocysteine nucleosidase
MATFRNGRGPVGKLADAPVKFLICFAVREECKFFMPPPSCGCAPVQTWITGIGRRNAAESVREAVARLKPERVLTCGFAGGLNPKLQVGTVVYDCDFDIGLVATLEELGAVSALFHCAKRVAVTAGEKKALWESTGADVVEMESSVIRTICQEFRIPSATIRVISDSARQDLPLDFNALMTSDDRINYAKLAWKVFASPTKIPRLIEFQRQTILTARRLAEVLEALLRKSCR